MTTHQNVTGLSWGRETSRRATWHGGVQLWGRRPLCSGSSLAAGCCETRVPAPEVRCTEYRPGQEHARRALGRQGTQTPRKTHGSGGRGRTWTWGFAASLVYSLREEGGPGLGKPPPLPASFLCLVHLWTSRLLLHVHSTPGK